VSETIAFSHERGLDGCKVVGRHSWGAHRAFTEPTTSHPTSAHVASAAAPKSDETERSPDSEAVASSLPQAVDSRSLPASTAHRNVLVRTEDAATVSLSDHELFTRALAAARKRDAVIAERYLNVMTARALPYTQIRDVVNALFPPAARSRAFLTPNAQRKAMRAFEARR
jgi:hypothetical protein